MRGGLGVGALGINFGKLVRCQRHGALRGLSRGQLYLVEVGGETAGSSDDAGV
jgi:hypothetical protein